MTDSAVLAMALDDMELLGLIKWKPDADKKPTIDEGPEAQGQANNVQAECDWRRASFAEHRSLDDQVRQLLEQASAKAALKQ